MTADASGDAARGVLALAEEEHQLVLEGRVDELEGVQGRRVAAMDRLPEILSEEARGALSHALALQREISAALTQALAVTGDELGRVTHGRAAARGYAPAGLDGRRTLDRTA